MENIIGTTIGIFEVISKGEKKMADGHSTYHVRCTVCGHESDMVKTAMVRTHKCRHKSPSGAKVDFGKSPIATPKLRKTLSDIKLRCYSENAQDAKWYKDKGVTVCEEWLYDPTAFEKWSIANGYADNLSLVRIDKDAGFSPENCRWVTHAEATANKSTTTLLSANGEIHSGREWSARLGLGTNTINNYVRKYGAENVEKFIDKYIKTGDRPHNTSRSLYETYMR